MKRLIPAVLVLIFTLSSCGGKLTRETAETWPDGSPRKVALYSGKGDKKVKVKEILYYQSGKTEMEGEFAGGKKDGLWVCWFENGKKQSEGSYRNDLRNGKAVVWRENGYKYYEGTYSMGRLHGIWIMYDENGARLKEVLYEHDRKVKEMDFSTGAGK